MFCPVCKVEYRSGFTRCADCDVDLVQELQAEFVRTKTEKAIADNGRAKSPTKSVATFVLHQFIGVYGIPYTAPIVFSLVFKCLFLFGHTYPRKAFYSVVSGLPYFPRTKCLRIDFRLAAWPRPSTAVNSVGLGTALGHTLLFGGHIQSLDPYICACQHWPISVLTLLRMGLPT
jgi:hypothetical protein